MCSKFSLKSSVQKKKQKRQKFGFEKWINAFDLRYLTCPAGGDSHSLMMTTNVYCFREYFQSFFSFQVSGVLQHVMMFWSDGPADTDLLFIIKWLLFRVQAAYGKFSKTILKPSGAHSSETFRTNSYQSCPKWGKKQTCWKLVWWTLILWSTALNVRSPNCLVYFYLFMFASLALKYKKVV